jgi:hypothetical protein
VIFFYSGALVYTSSSTCLPLHNVKLELLKFFNMFFFSIIYLMQACCTVFNKVFIIMYFIPTEPVKGYVVCIYACVQGRCKNMIWSIIWIKCGCQLQNHSSNAYKHLHCTFSYPGYVLLNQSHASFSYSWLATKDD